MAASLNAANEQHNPQQTPAMYRIYDGEYFEIIKRENDILLVRCLTCGPDGLPLRSSVKSNGNILKHIKVGEHYRTYPLDYHMCIYSFHMCAASSS